MLLKWNARHWLPVMHSKMRFGGEILYTADSLADIEQYDERNWGGNAYEYALSLCLDAVLALDEEK